MLNIGIIGTGLIAREHAQALSMLPDAAVLVAATDVNQERLQDFCASFHVPRRYRYAEELIVDPEVDLVSITTPPSVHERLAVAALDARKYVFCEKPLAHSLASASLIAAAEASNPGRLTVSHQLRYEPTFRRLVWLCRNGWIGEIQSALIERHSYLPQTIDGKNGWWGSWKVAGGGVLITQLIHELDLLLLVMGRPLAVSALMDTRYTGIESEDYVEMTIRFPGGAAARCIASVNSGCVRGGFTIQGSSGSIGLPWKLTTTDPQVASRATEELDKALPDTRTQSSSLLGRGSRFLAKAFGVKARPALTPHARLYQEIFQSIKRGDRLPIPPAEALGSLELCFAAYESVISGKEIGVPLDSTSAVYRGVTREDYDARKGSKKTPQRATIRTVRTNVTANPIRVGIIGLDTSHAVAFTSILHNPGDPFHIPGARVVVAYPGGSPDMPISISRVAGFTSELKNKYGVRIVDEPADVPKLCDLVFLLACDGRIHPALFHAVAAHGKPVFVDKPFAVSASDAERMFMLAAENKIRVFASSAFRYADGLVSALQSVQASGERVKTCCIRFWHQIQETQGRYFWYGIHAVEMLQAIMQCGARVVEASARGDQDSITVWHDDERQSSLIGSKNDGTFHVSIVTENRELNIELGSSMASLSANLLWAALDVLTAGHFPRLWAASTEGSVCGIRPGRFLDPALEDTVGIVRLLDAAERSYASQQKIALAEYASIRSAAT